MPTPEQAFEDLEYLQEQGFNIPDALLDLVTTEVNKKHAVKQLWFCKKCKTEYKSNIVISGINCGLSHPMSLLKRYP